MSSASEDQKYWGPVYIMLEEDIGRINDKPIDLEDTGYTETAQSPATCQFCPCQNAHKKNQNCMLWADQTEEIYSQAQNKTKKEDMLQEYLQLTSAQWLPGNEGDVSQPENHENVPSAYEYSKMQLGTDLLTNMIPYIQQFLSFDSGKNQQDGADKLQQKNQPTNTYLGQINIDLGNDQGFLGGKDIGFMNNKSDDINQNQEKFLCLVEEPKNKELESKDSLAQYYSDQKNMLQENPQLTANAQLCPQVAHIYQSSSKPIKKVRRLAGDDIDNSPAKQFKIYKRKPGRPKESKNISKQLQHYWSKLKPNLLESLKKILEPQSSVHLFQKVIDIEKKTINARKQDEKWYSLLADDQELRPFVLRVLQKANYEKLWTRRSCSSVEVYRKNHVPVLAYFSCNLEYDFFKEYRDFYHLYYLPSKDQNLPADPS